ncbi:hypothetical protein LRH25_32230 [Ideonella azotifigens]|uniref:FIST domain-containing protein n=1 Tax=Ideonella azotifigens TaxID=513160 RepID=A0ABN1KLH6_9BURK|nr:hypothetical protein [Ideonella azotifigens]MCD2344991.1 hypothetical protein [Ideonella azotifigens]
MLQHGFLDGMETIATLSTTAVQSSDVQANVQALAAYAAAHPELSCVIFGTGAQTAQCYRDLAALPGVTLLFSESVTRGALRLLSWLVPSHCGLLQLDEVRLAWPLFDKLMDASMAGLYLFERALLPEVIAQARAASSTLHYGLGLQQQPAHVAYLVDGDNEEVASGIVQIVSVGTAITGLQLLHGTPA